MQFQRNGDEEVNREDINDQLYADGPAGSSAQHEDRERDVHW